MKKLVSLLLCVSLLACTMTGCARDLNVNGKVASPYGVFNMDDKSPCVKYKVCIGNVVWACIFSGSIVVPIVILGWYLLEPVGPKDCDQSAAK
jgi:hypothetical protein